MKEKKFIEDNEHNYEQEFFNFLNFDNKSEFVNEEMKFFKKFSWKKYNNKNKIFSYISSNSQSMISHKVLKIRSKSQENTKINDFFNFSSTFSILKISKKKVKNKILNILIYFSTNN